MDRGRKKSKIIFILIIAITILIGILIILKNHIKLSLQTNVNNIRANVFATKNYYCPNGGSLNKSTGKCTITANSIKKCNGTIIGDKCYLTTNTNNTISYECDGDVKPNSANKCIYTKKINTECPSGYSKRDQYTCIKLMNSVKSTYLECPSGYSQIGSSNICKYTYNATPKTEPSCSNGSYAGNGNCRHTYDATKNTYLECPSGYYQSGSGSTCIYTYNASRVSRNTYKCQNGGTLKGKKCTKTVTGSWRTNYTCPGGGTFNGSKCEVITAATFNTKYSCPNGGQVLGNTCIVKTNGEWKNNYSCPSGQLQGDKCLVSTNIESSCPSGYYRISNSDTCKKEESAKIINFNQCPSGYTKLGNKDYYLYNQLGKKDCYKIIDMEYGCSNSAYKLTSGKNACTYTYNAAITSISCSEIGYYYDVSSKKCKKKNDSENKADNSDTPKNPNDLGITVPTVPSKEFDKKSSPLEVSPSNIAIIYADQKQKLEVKGLADGESVTFQSKNKNVAMVDSNGVITPIGVGKTNIVIRRNNRTNVNDECIVIVKVASMQIPITEIKISFEKEILNVGETTKIIPSVIPENATSKTLKYSSLNKKVATVDSNGIVNAKGVGETIIYASALENSNIARGIKLTVQDKKKNQNIYDEDIPNSIVVKDDDIIEKYIATDVNKVYMDVLDTKQLKSKYYILHQNGKIAKTTENNEDLLYMSENENIAMVSEKGLVTARNVGKTNIKVYSKTEPTIYKKVKIIVEETNLTLENEIKVEESIIDMVKGDTKTIKVLEHDIDSLKFTSKNSKIAKINSKGKITAVNVGTTEIVVKSRVDNKKTKIITINVHKEDSFDKFESNNDIVKISLNYNRIDIVKGNKLKIKSSASDNSKLLWKSSNSKIVQVNQSGTIKALRKGKATITVYSKDNSKIKEKIIVTVVKREKELKKLDEVNTKELGLKTQNVTIQVEGTKQIKFKKDVQDVIYRSEDEKVAKVDENGLITAISPGKTKIMVTTTKSSDYVSVKVIKKVVPKEIKLNESNIELSLGEEYILKPVVSPKKAKNKNLLYASTNSDIAEVTDDGKIIAKGVGSAYIAAISEEVNSIKTYIHVTVK